jgi:hypothetical protein
VADGGGGVPSRVCACVRPNCPWAMVAAGMVETTDLEAGVVEVHCGGAYATAWLPGGDAVTLRRSSGDRSKPRIWHSQVNLT